MTLILSCVTEDYAIQVSDRRLSKMDIRTGKIRNVEDNENKAVMLGTSMVFSYTGLGEIEGIRTDLWLARLIYSIPRGKSFNDIVETIRNKATECFKNIPWPQKIKRHAFVGAGWTRESKDAPLSPTIVLISNFQSKGGVLDEAEDEFQIWNSPKFLKSDKHFLLVTGSHPTSTEEKEFRKKYIHELNRNLKRCVAKKVSPQLLMVILVIAVRQFASRYEPVGKSLMAVCLPKASVERKDSRKFILSSLPTPGAPTFLYIPGDFYKGIHFAPIFVFPGTSMMTEFKIIPISGPVSNWPRVVETVETVVLTEWIGTGTREYTRRPAVADDYTLKGWSDITGALSWPKNEPCPYYGYLVAIKAEPDLVNQIRNDSRYVVVASHEEPLQEVPGQEWIGKLKAWLAARGMPVKELEDFISNIQGCKREEIIDKLKQLLKIPVRTEKE